MSEYFTDTKSSRSNVKVVLDLSNYATKADLKNATEVGISDFVKKTDLTNLKLDVDKLDFNKFKNVPTGLNSLKSKVGKFSKQK